MKLAIFGATGRTGHEVTKQALAAGHSVTAFVRNPERLAIEDQNLTVLTGDVLDPKAVSEAIRGQNAIVCALGGGQDLKKTSVRATGTANIIQGMKEHKVSRLAAVTAMGTGDSWDSLSFVNKLFFATVLKSARADHEAQEAEIKKSGLDWTILRPSGLTDKPHTGIYEYGENIPAVSSTIARADVADLILKALGDDQLIGKTLTISN